MHRFTYRIALRPALGFGGPSPTLCGASVPTFASNEIVGVQRRCCVPSVPTDFFPSGDSSFEGIRRQRQFWCDNSNFIFDLVENKEAHQLLVRPPRWGKSLFLDMLHCYLDINQKDQFDELFGGTKIYRRKDELEHRNR